MGARMLVPTIDISQPTAASMQALDVACRDHGFVLLRGHGLDDLVERTWEQTRRFFAAAPELKRSVVRSDDNALGYYDRELTKRKRDHKEVFDYMQPDSPIGRERNRWPRELPGFRETMAEFFEAFGRLSAETMRLVHRSLGLPPAVIERHGGSPDVSTVRLNHYPIGDPVHASERAGLAGLGDVALGDHTDPGVITLLLQDERGGLQTLTRDGTWIDVPPQSGTIVVNLADAVQVWTNDRYRAAVHRVVPMTEGARYSIPYFFNPHIDSVIEPIRELCDGAPRYRPFTWREFIVARINDNYADLGADDTQIGHFRIESSAQPAGDASVR
jgi:isopenicillin N synthase-like dioxygenase